MNHSNDEMQHIFVDRIQQLLLLLKKKRRLVVYDPMISLSKFVHNFKCSCRRREFSVLFVSVNGKEEKESSSYLIHIHYLLKIKFRFLNFFRFHTGM